jgi:hypothetical protein
MRKQTFDRVKKTIGILLAVFLVVTLTVASASACSTKSVKNLKPVNNLGNNLGYNLGNNLGYNLGNNLGYNLGNNLGYNLGNNGLLGNGLLGNNGWDGYNNGWDGYNNGCDSCNNGFDNNY